MREKAEALGTKRRIHLHLVARGIRGRKPAGAYDLRDLEDIMREPKTSYPEVP